MNTSLVVLIVLLSTSFWVALIVVLVRAAKKASATHAVGTRGADDWATLASALGAEHIRSGLNGQQDGKPFRCRHEAGTRKHTISFGLRLDHPFPDVVKLAKESGFHRLCKRIGLEVEVETGDLAFDERFYVNADNPEYARALLATPEDRTRLVALDSACQGFSESVKIVLDREGVGVTLVNYRRGSLSADDLRTLLGHMSALALPVPAQAAARARSSHAGHVAQRVGWIVFSIVGVVGSIIAAVAGTNEYDPVENELYWQALRSAAFAWMGFVALSFLLIRGRSWSGPIYLAVLLCSLEIFPVGGVAAYALYNGAADTGAPTQHPTRAVSLHITTSKNSKTYHLTLAPWREGTASPRFTVSRGLYQSLSVGAPVLVTTRPGALGYEWVVSIRRAEAETP